MQVFILGLTYLILLGAGLAHVLWALGVWWPIWDEQRLARTVVGAPGITKMPPGWASALVAAALGGSGIVLFGLTQGMAVIPDRLLVWAGWVLVAVFGLRGVASYVLPLFSVRMEEPFARLNLMFYGPLCLILAAGFWSAL
ncbi:DUF3995 domain-containing protein [Aliiroseovarius marinus]|uniref:DUF3995 domain-containing protein n=1 Tax=Aliiroseovarius marinus TaxID=2500159 RepID=UPI002495661A|nr:DUF3995 domain-containing protein [Aliiroseovarius marinus]